MKSYQKGSAALWSIGIIAILLIIGGGVYVTSKPSSDTPSSDIEVSTASPVSGEWSLEAHDGDNHRIGLCQSFDDSCRETLTQQPAVDAMVGKEAKNFNDAISGYIPKFAIGGKGAKEYCENLEESEHKDWRLPTAGELLAASKQFKAELDASSDYMSHSPVNDPNLNAFHIGQYWSSSKSKSNGVIVIMDDARTTDGSSGNAEMVRCIR